MMVLYLGMPSDKQPHELRTVVLEWDGSWYNGETRDPETLTWEVSLPANWPDWAILRGCSHRPGTTVSITIPDGTVRLYKRGPKRRRSWKWDGPPDPNWRTTATVYFEEVGE